VRTATRLADGGLLHESIQGGATHYRPGLDIDGRWMHVTDGDAFTDDPSAVTCPACATTTEGPTT